MAFDDDDDPSFFQRNRALVIVGVVLLLGGGAFFAWKAVTGLHQSSSRSDEMEMVRLPPLPPPPPPKPQPTPPPLQTPPPEQAPDQKMVEQAPVQDVPKEAPKAPAAPAPLGTSISGPGGGPDLGLGGGLGGGGGYGPGGGGGGSKYGWYASEVQSRVADALRNNPRTRSASMKIVVRIWPDSTGRVSKAHIQGSTGDPTLDSALNDILVGMQLNDPPPSDMPLPIVMRLTALRPQ
jgi:TonB family protein